METNREIIEQFICGCAGCPFQEFNSGIDYPDYYTCTHPDGSTSMLDVRELKNIGYSFFAPEDCPFLKADYTFKISENFKELFDKSMQDKKFYEIKIKAENVLKEIQNKKRLETTEIEQLKKLAEKYPDVIIDVKK